MTGTVVFDIVFRLSAGRVIDGEFCSTFFPQDLEAGRRQKLSAEEVGIFFRQRFVIDLMISYVISRG